MGYKGKDTRDCHINDVPKLIAHSINEALDNNSPEDIAVSVWTFTSGDTGKKMEIPNFLIGHPGLPKAIHHALEVEATKDVVRYVMINKGVIEASDIPPEAIKDVWGEETVSGNIKCINIVAVDVLTGEHISVCYPFIFTDQKPTRLVPVDVTPNDIKQVTSAGPPGVLNGALKKIYGYRDGQKLN